MPLSKIQDEMIQVFGDTGVDVDLIDGKPRITGDFSNATVANRVMFQTSAVNDQTSIGVLPSGTNTSANINLFGGSSPANASIGQLVNTGAEVRLSATFTGTGPVLPMTFYTGGSERMRIDTSGDATFQNIAVTGTTNDNYVFTVKSANRNAALVLDSHGVNGLGSVQGYTLGVQKSLLGFDKDGNIVSKLPYGGIGYGIGAGGTVTQTTSKSTAVTLNKPCGQITMHNASLAAGATVFFLFNNSLISAGDILHLTFLNSIGSQNYNVWAGVAGASAQINLRNISGAPLAESVIINFAIIKGATA